MAIQKKKTPDSGIAAGKSGQPGEETAGKPITVHSFAGFKQDERPRSFELDGKRLTVLRVKKTWKDESAEGRRRKTFFQVHAHDGRTYDLAQDEGTGQWTLEPRGNRG